jgi:hypothetical protein
MSKRYDFFGNGTTLIPIADAEHFTNDISLDYGSGACFLQFIDADGLTVVSPSGGTIEFQSASIGEQYQPSADGVINAVDVTITDSPYTPTRFQLPVLKSKMILTGITGATFVIAYHLRT